MMARRDLWSIPASRLSALSRASHRQRRGGANVVRAAHTLETAVFSGCLQPVSGSKPVCPSSHGATHGATTSADQHAPPLEPNSLRQVYGPLAGAHPPGAARNVQEQVETRTPTERRPQQLWLGNIQRLFAIHARIRDEAPDFADCEQLQCSREDLWTNRTSLIRHA